MLYDTLKVDDSVFKCIRFYVCSAADVVLQSVQKEIVEPTDQAANLKHNISTNLARHQQHLQDVQELLSTAKHRSNQTEHLLMNIHTNLEEYKVSVSQKLS